MALSSVYMNGTDVGACSCERNTATRGVRVAVGDRLVELGECGPQVELAVLDLDGEAGLAAERVVTVEGDHLVTHLGAGGALGEAGGLGQVAIRDGQRAHALIDEVFEVEALHGGLLVDVVGGVDDAEVLGDTADLVGHVAHLRGARCRPAPCATDRSGCRRARA